MTEPTFLYRVEEQRFAGGVDEYGDPIPGDRGPLEVRLRCLEVAKRTPKGWRLRDGAFVMESATKKYANPTIEGAFVDFLARKEKQARIYMARAAEAMQAKHGAERLKEGLVERLPNPPRHYSSSHVNTDRLIDGVEIVAKRIMREIRR